MKTKRFTKRKIGIIVLALLLLAGASVFALEKSRITNFVSSPSDTSGPTDAQVKEQEKVNDDVKKNFIEQETPASPTPVVPTSSDDIVFTAQQEENGNVTVLTKLYGFPDGDCSLVIQNGPKSATKTAQIIYQPEFSSCAGFSVTKSELGPGTWSITLTAKTSASDPLSKTQTLEVK